MMPFKPTLAVNAKINDLVYPLWGSPKLDGIRCSILGGKALSRTLKPIPNLGVYNALSFGENEGLDGELILGSPRSPSVYRDTVSHVMSYHSMSPGIVFYVFDLHNHPGDFTARYLFLRASIKRKVPGPASIKVLEQTWIENEDQMIGYEAHCVGEGYEGIMLRSPTAPYKHGRSTMKEQYLMKVKRFLDAEATIIGFEEENHNGNCAEVNELGRTKRSSAKAGLCPKGTLGAFRVRDLVTGIDFSIGTGLTAAERDGFWAARDKHLGAIVKYKFFPVGVKTAPRHPVFLGFRDPIDI